MKKSIIIMFLLWAVVLTGLPINVAAQTRTNTSGPGTSAYYSDDSVVRTVTTRVKINRLGWIHVGGNPQVKGGLYNIAPASDEEDVELTREITIMTMSASRVLYIGQLPTVLDNGTKVIVRRKIGTRKIIAIVNCGNWAREIGAETEVILDKQIDYLKCEPFKDGRRKIRDEVIGNTRYEEYDDGCKKEVITTITNTTPGINTTECVPNSWLEVVRAGNDTGRVSGKKFKAADMIPADIREQVLTQAPDLRDKKVKFLQVLQGACESERNKFKLVWFTGDGGWHWKEFLIGFGAGFLTGYLVRGTSDCPVLIPPTTGGSPKYQPGNNGNTRPNITPSNPTTTNTRPRIIP